MKIAIHQLNNRSLKTTAGAIDAGKVFERAGKQMFLQPINKGQLAAKCVYLHKNQGCGGEGSL